MNPQRVEGGWHGNVPYQQKSRLAMNARRLFVLVGRRRLELRTR